MIDARWTFDIFKNFSVNIRMGAFEDIFNEIFKPVILVVDFFVKFFRALPNLVKTMIKTLVYFVVNFIPLMFKLLKNVALGLQTAMHYLSNPLQLFDVLVRIVVFVAIMVVSILYHLPVQRNYKLGDMIVYIMMLPVTTGIFLWRLSVWFTFELVLEYGMLRPLDKVTKGSLSTFYYRNLLAIENPPDAWYTVPNHQFQNKNTRHLFAFKACPANYVPNGVFCTRKEPYESDFCDMSKIYGLTEGEDVSTKNSRLNQNSRSYMSLSSDDKELTVADYRERIALHKRACDVSLSSKQPLIHGICLDHDDMRSTNVDMLCKNVFCQDKFSNVCHKYTDVRRDSEGFQAKSSNVELIFKMLAILMIVLIVARKFKV